MDSDQDSSADDWVYLNSCTSSSDDDDRVLALSSGCASPTTYSDSDSDADDRRLSAAAAALAAADDDAEGVYALSEAEDDYAYPPVPAPLPKPLAGLFHHRPARRVAYEPFDPAAPTGPHHAARQLVPDPAFSALPEPVAVLASARGLVCLRGYNTKSYYVANPATFRSERLPPHSRDHSDLGDPAVVIAFENDGLPDAGEGVFGGLPFYRHYHVVVAFPVAEGVYAFESFSSRTWTWTVAAGIAAAETVVPASGVGALGCAFWRTTLGYFLCYEPLAAVAELIPAPVEVLQWPVWELGEMEGTLCATCVDDRVSAVVVIRLDPARRRDNGDMTWTLAGHFEGGCLRGRQAVSLLRSQAKAEVVMWDPTSAKVVAMDLEGRTTRTIGPICGRDYYTDFVPYISTLAQIKAVGNNKAHAECRTTASNEVGAELMAMAVDAEAY